MKRLLPALLLTLALMRLLPAAEPGEPARFRDRAAAAFSFLEHGGAK